MRLGDLDRKAAIHGDARLTQVTKLTVLKFHFYFKALVVI